MNFTVHKTHRDYKDFLVVKVDLNRAQGFWTGWLEIDGKREQLDQRINGVLEVSDSLF